MNCMKNIRTYLICLILLVKTGSTDAQLITPDYLFNSDPTCHEINGRFYVFTSHDQSTVNFQRSEDGWHNIMDNQAYSTLDFITWKHHASILSTHDFEWAHDFKLWDGDAFCAGILYGINQEMPYGQCLQLAHAAAWHNLKYENSTDGAVSTDILKQFIKNHKKCNIMNSF